MIDPHLSRRDILAASAVSAAGLLMPSAPARAEDSPPLRGKIRKSMIVKVPTETTLTPYKEAGFEGVEVQTFNGIDEAEGIRLRKIAEGMGMRIHSVMRGWASFNFDDDKKRNATIEETRQAMRAAHWYGADDILLVPCRIGPNEVTIPEPGDFDIEFDEKTLHVSRVVQGDNSKFAGYIAAQNKATDMTRKAVEELIPLAEELKIIIAIENVWNNLWVQPKLARALVASFNHPYVKSYFDVGNHVKYRKTPIQDWIPILGSLIVRLHWKGYKLGAETKDDKWVTLREGSIDWPAVRKALSDINYDGWASIEENRLTLAEYSKEFDLIVAGK